MPSAADASVAENSLYATAKTLLESMRVEISQLSKSADRRWKVEEEIDYHSKRAWKEVEEYRQWAIRPNHGCDPVKPSFYFVPISTAPAVRLATSSFPQEAPTAPFSRQQGLASRRRPPWNASTLLSDDAVPADAAPRQQLQRQDASTSTERRAAPVAAVVIREQDAHVRYKTSPPGGQRRGMDGTPQHALLSDQQTKATEPREVEKYTTVKGIGAPARRRRVPVPSPRDISAVPRDAEKKRAIQDYLRRMGILRYTVPLLGAVGDGGSDRNAQTLLLDAILNGAALAQLAMTVAKAAPTTAALDESATYCRRPQSFDDIQWNYDYALNILRGQTRLSGSIPPFLWSIEAEDVYMSASPTHLLDLYIHLISTHLPPPEELPRSMPLLLWQPPADVVDEKPEDPEVLRSQEEACLQFLFECGVLPDVGSYELPGDECLVPSSNEAPYVPRHTEWQPRQQPPDALYVPSVFPYLTNGVVLCDLCRCLGVEDATKARRSAPQNSLSHNPRTQLACQSNVTHSFDCLRVVCRSTESLYFFSEESAAEVLQGNRRHIVALLLHIYHQVVRGAAEDSPQAILSNTPTHSRSPGVVPSSRALSSVVSTSAAAAIVQEANSSSGGAVNASVSSMWPTSFPSSTGTILRERRTSSASGPATTGGSSQLAWLVSVLGPDFHYAAEHTAYAFNARTATLSEPCLFFSDGVLLAHLISLLERRRCTFLDCVQPTTKPAARRFNVKRCLEFLRDEKGVVFDIPLIEEGLLSGAQHCVVSLLRTLRKKYHIVTVN